MNEWREWGSPNWPDWRDIGKLAELKMQDGEIVRGVLEYEEMTPGPDEAPIIFIKRTDGTHAFLADAEFWRYVAAVQSNGRPDNEPPGVTREAVR